MSWYCTFLDVMKKLSPIQEILHYTFHVCYLKVNTTIAWILLINKKIHALKPRTPTLIETLSTIFGVTIRPSVPIRTRKDFLPYILCIELF